MFENVVKYLESLHGDGKAQFAAGEVQSAVAALLCRMVTIDGRVAPEEEAMLRDVLGSHFGLATDEVGKLVETGLAETKWRTTLYPYTMILNRTCDRAERARIFHDLMQLAFADGVLEAREEAMLHHTRGLLKLDEGSVPSSTSA